MTAVVGFDGSRPSATAARWAAVEAHRVGDALRVVSAADPTGAGALPPDVLPAGVSHGRPDQRVSSRRMAEQGADLARAVDGEVVVRGVGVVGGPAGVLVAQSGDAAFLVVGRRSDASSAWALGSVSFAVAMHAWCPVVLVPERSEVHPGPEHPVVVGVDGSRASAAVVEVATRFARVGRAPLRVISAWQRPPAGTWPEVDGVSEEAIARAARTAACTRVERAVERAAALAPDVELRPEVVEGTPTEVLVDASRGAGLTVVGSRGHGGFAGLALGSVGHGVLRGAFSPVAVVRRGAL